MMRRISSDTMAKVNAFAVALILLVVGSAGILGGFFLLNNSRTTTYEVTIEVTDMQVAESSGHVYNVCNATPGGDRYYDPDFNTVSRITPSDKAILYLSATIDDVEKFSERKTVKVQTASVPVAGEPVQGNTIKFKITTASTDVEVTLFLLLRGAIPENSSEASILPDGTPVDIYGDSPGQNGIGKTLNLKEEVREIELTGNAGSDMRGLLKATVTSKVI